MKNEKFEQLNALLIREQDALITYFISKLPMKNNSNVFLRDMQGVIHLYLEMKGHKIGYTDAENLTFSLFSHFEKNGQATFVGKNTWRVNSLIKAATPETVAETAE